MTEDGASFSGGALIPPDLPRGSDLVRAGRDRGGPIEIVPSRYVRSRGFSDEQAWKRHLKEEAILTSHINIGYKTWQLTADAVNELNARGEKLGFHVDRLALTADRRMGLPPEMRAAAVAETGQMLDGERDWRGTGTDIDTQCELNDHTFGSPAAVDNTAHAIRSGITYIGNLAQIYYEYPGFPDDVERISRTVEAMGMIAAKAPACAVNNYLDDGFCGSFHDVATMVGWAIMCRYVTEELVGVEQTQTFGSQWTDPLNKQAFALALEKINRLGTPMALTHGDTNSFSPEDSFDRNATLLAVDAYYSAVRELHHPSGAAIHVTPVSEAIRIPTMEDFVQSLEIGAEAMRRARSDSSMVDWRPVHELRDRMVEGGRRVFERMLKRFPELGVDVRDPLQILLAAVRLDAPKIEELFGVGEPNDSYPRGFEPLVPSEVLQRLLGWRDAAVDATRSRGGLPDLSGIRVVAASCDVHEYGLFVMSDLLDRCGATVISLGTSVDPSEIAKVARESAADALAIGTYNGMALGLSREIRGELDKREIRPLLFLGGRLTEDRDGDATADVRDDLRRVGAIPCDTIPDFLLGLRPALADRA